MQDEPIAAPDLPGLECSPFELPTTTSKFDLTLFITQSDSGLSSSFEYDTDLFDASTIRRMAAHLNTLFENIVANPDARIAEIPIMNPQERRQVLVEWSKTAAHYPTRSCVHDLCREQGRVRPDALAITCGEVQLSYAELNRRANQVARFLRNLGVGPESIVGILMERSADMVVGMLGVLKAGGAYLPLDPAYPQERIAYMLKDAEVSTVFTQKHLAPNLNEDVAQVMCLDSDWTTFCFESGDDFSAEVSAENLAYVIYTSGSTGKPKGAQISHGALLNLIGWHQQAYRVSSADRATQLAGVGFDACVWELWPYLSAGASVHMPDEDTRLSPAVLRNWLSEEAITISFVPTPLAEILLSLKWEPQISLRAMLTGGEQLHVHPPESLPFALINNYGPTENTVVATSGEVKPNDGNSRLPSIGRPISNSEVYLLDPGMELAAIGTQAELFIGGQGLARGYLGRGDLTAERFLPDPFSHLPGGRLYRTGDLARYLADGEIDYRGRVDHQVKLRGFRIELGEIEATLEQHPSLAQALVVARGDGHNMALVAYVVAGEGEEIRGGELSQYLRERLPLHMVPSAVVVIQQMPLTPNGKIDRNVLPAPTREDYGVSVEVSEPRTETERRLAEIYSQVLGVERVGVSESFFDLGGHSLMATRLLSRIQQEWKIRLALRKVFERPSVEAMAAQIEDALGGAEGVEQTSLIGERRGGLVPMSFSQQRVWFLHQMGGAASAYNIAGGLRMRGSLSEGALREALKGVVRRHEVLRTSYGEQEGEMVQIVHEDWECDLRVLDLRGEENAEQELIGVGRQEAEGGFDLEAGPVMRQVLVRMGEQEHVLVMVVHHIAADGWSIGVLMKEVGALYREEIARESGMEVEGLKEMSLQYGDYAIWQRERLSGEVMEEGMRYWREKLAGAAEVLELPTDRARPVVQSYRGSVEVKEMREGLKEELEEVGRREGATLFMVMLGVFKVLLWRYTGQEDISVGTAIANREVWETEGMIGFFANTLVMRSSVRGEMRVKELLREVREAAVGGYAHQEVPFEKLVEDLHPQRDITRSPIFQVMFVLKNAPQEQFTLPGLDTELISIENGTSKFDLTLSMEEHDGRLFASAEYNVDLFQAATVKRMLNHLEMLLEGAAADAEQQIADLPMLTVTERIQLTSGWNQTRKDYSQPECLHELFVAQVQRTPDSLAVAFEDQQITYQELNRRANRLAHDLRSQGVAAGALVAVLMERSAEMVIGLLGILKSGGAYLPIDAEYPQARIDFMLRDAQPVAVLTQEVVLEKLSGISSVLISLDNERRECGEEFEINIESGATGADLAYVIYTSGSTGKPKAAMNTHAGICNRLLWMQDEYRLTHGDRALQKTPFSFDVSVWEFFWPLMTGAQLVLASPGRHQDSSYMVNLIKQQRVTTMHFVPSMLQIFIEEPDVSSCDSLRRVICSGEALPLDLQERFFSRIDSELHNLYGPTEAAVDVTYWACEPGEKRRSVPIGRPIANTECYVLDSRMGLTPVGAVGELHLGGLGLARGYLGRPELTAEKFIPNAFSDKPGARLYRTGDLARHLDGGEIEYLGRVDNQIKLRGFRIELGEIETRLAEHSQIREAVVIARDLGAGDKRLVAHLVANQEPRPVVSELRVFLKDKLPDFMVPSSFIFHDALPLTPNGKIDRGGLSKMEFVEPKRETPRLAPRNEIERAIAAIWKEVLKVENVDIDDNFFDLGGHSLLIMQIHRRLREQFKRDLSLVDLFRHPTISSLARHLGENAEDQTATDDGILEKLSQGKQRLKHLRKGPRPVNR
jgi:amino acid adenylation domain-containing protein